MRSKTPQLGHMMWVNSFTTSNDTQQRMWLLRATILRTKIISFNLITLNFDKVTYCRATLSMAIKTQKVFLYIYIYSDIKLSAWSYSLTTIIIEHLNKRVATTWQLMPLFFFYFRFPFFIS